MATSTITALSAVLAADLDDTALFAVDDNDGHTRKATVAQVRTQIIASHLRPTDDTYDLGAAGATRWRNCYLSQDLVVGDSATIAGTAYIGDTANANATLGLTINQGANDDELLAGKSSDVAHGMTTQTEDDTFASIKKVSATTGGAAINGFTESTIAVSLLGHSTSDDTTKTTAGVGAVLVNARLKTGTTSGDCGADANLFVVRNNLTARFIFDAEGTFHADVGSTTF